MSVYALSDPRTGRTRYVGHSKNPVRRLVQHCRAPHSAAMTSWIRELSSEGRKPLLRLLDGGTEAKWIAKLAPDLNVMLTGRPSLRRLPPGAKRTHFVGCSMNDREYDTVQECADREGRTVADWLRRIAVPTVRA